MLQVPAAFAAFRQFILYKTVPSRKKPGKLDKLPVDWRTAEVVEAHNPAAWCSVDEARAAAQLWGLGVGFVFTDADPFWFLDLDECLLPDGKWSPVAQQLCQVFAGCAIEVSVSARGLHIFGSGVLPEHRCDVTGLGGLYHTLRFVALTGTGLQGDAGHTPAPEVLQWLVSSYFPPREGAADPDDWRHEPVPEWSGPTDDDELVQRLLRQAPTAGAAFGGRASFRDLWEGNADALGRAFPDPSRAYNASSADSALAAHLAWATGKNHERVRRIMERSALRRDKWERDDYLPRTVGFAVGRTQRVMQDRPAVATAVPAAPGSFLAAAAGAIPATLTNVQGALRSAESGIRLAYDEFQAAIVIGADGVGWRPLEDVDYVNLRTAFEDKGFKPIAHDLMRHAVLAVAKAHPIDTAQQWLDGLRWDGTPRVEQAMCRYFGAADTPYSRAVGRYLFSALAGRVLDPGCQVDMVPVLIGPEGLRKTSAVAALAPSPEAFAEFHLDKLDDNVSRQLRGCLVGELAELRGLKTSDAQAIRAWITKRHEAWVPKYQEFATRFPRRCVFVGTSNPRDILNDPEGHRRWLPLDVTRADDAAITADRDQLWAEGAALWRAHGVLWSDAQALATAEHGKFEEQDEWHDLIAATLARPRPATPGEVPNPTPLGAQPFGLTELARLAVGLNLAQLDRRASLRVGAILRKLGYEKRDTWINGRNVKCWTRLAQAQGLAT